jgi:transcriptional regulator with XRE-family HTH domain
MSKRLPELAAAMEEAMAAAGITSSLEGSEKTGISYEWYRRIRGGVVPSEEFIEKIAQGLEYDINKLRTAAGYGLKEPQNIDQAVELAMRVSGKFEDVSDERKELIKDQIKSFIERMNHKYNE